MILLPVITYFYGVEVAVPVSTIAQLMSNLSRVGMGWKHIDWKAADVTRGRFDVQWADGLPTVTLSGDEMEDITVNFLSL